MEGKLFEVVLSQGIFASLFTYLFLYILKQSSKREEQYQLILNEIIKSLPEIKNSIKEIDNYIRNKK